MSAFTINLYQPRAGFSAATIELARHIPDQLGGRVKRAA
jgi:hypothetical protein